jgi:hypothetical protein
VSDAVLPEDIVVGLFAPPILAATVVGAAVGGLAGKFARKRGQAGIGEKMDDALPPGSAGVIAIYDHEHADLVDATLANAIRKSTAQIEGEREGAESRTRGSGSRACRRLTRTAAAIVRAGVELVQSWASRSPSLQRRSRP